MQAVDEKIDIDALKLDFDKKREQRGWHCVEMSRLAGLLAQAGIDGDIDEVSRLSARRLALQAAIRLETLAELKASLQYHSAVAEKTKHELTAVSAAQEKNKTQKAQLAAEAEKLTFRSQDLFALLHDSKSAITRAETELRAFTVLENNLADEGKN